MDNNRDFQADPLFIPDNFEIRNLQDEIRVNDLCDRLLKLFYLHQIEEEKLDAEHASSQAYGASYFLKDFVVDHYRENILLLNPHRVRQFAGNWYIVKNLEPNMVELQGILEGVKTFYRYCAKVGLAETERAAGIEKECSDLDFFHDRIERFWTIEKDGYIPWEAGCSLKN